MKKIVLTFGLISGVLCSLLMVSTLPFGEKIGFDKAAYVGYTILVASFLLVYFGIRRYRDTAGFGQITFARGFAVGILITLITCVFYVVTWEILYFNFMHGFMDQYAAYTVQKLKDSGASAAAVQAQVQAMAKYKQQYENPLFNSMITFIEPFPVGLVITLISALVLRRHKPQGMRMTSQSTPAAES